MEQINLLELGFIQFVQGLGDWLLLPMTIITNLGNEMFFIALLTAIYWCLDQGVGLRVGVMLLLGNASNTFFKFLIHNPRPYWFSGQVQAYSTESTSFGFPSGHSQMAAMVWGWLAVEVKKRWFTLTAITLIFLIGLSRIYLGVHFLSDVLFGWLIGGLLVWLFSALVGPIERWVAEKKLASKLVLVLLSTAALLLLVLGGDVLLMSTKGPFLAGQGGWRRLVRFLVGLLGVGLFWFGLGQVFPDEAHWLSYLLRFLRYLLTGLWVSWWAPLLFEKIDLLKFSHGDPD